MNSKLKIEKIEVAIELLNQLKTIESIDDPVSHPSDRDRIFELNERLVHEMMVSNSLRNRVYELEIKLGEREDPLQGLRKESNRL